LIYLASPHYHSIPEIVELRAIAARNYTAYLTKQGFPVYSPINHNHWLGVELSHEEWMRLDLRILRYATSVQVLCLPGWQRSKGVKIEKELAQTIGIPIAYIDQTENLKNAIGKDLWQKLSTLTLQES